MSTEREQEREEHSHRWIQDPKIEYRRKYDKQKWLREKTLYQMLKQKGKHVTYAIIRNGKEKSCLLCGKLFRTNNSRQRTCSHKCGSTQGRITQPPPKGKLSHAWKGGRRQLHGYIFVYTPDHPNASSNSGCIAEHRLVMEKHLKRYLTSNEEVHHRNGVKTDNRLENLELVVKQMHYGHVTCPYCSGVFKVK